MPDLPDSHARLMPIETQKRELARGLIFSQESIVLENERKTNLYWVEIDKNRFGFQLVTSTTPIPLVNYDLSDKKVVAAINFGSFFLSDDLHSPEVAFYNLLIKNGEVF